jgi:hypothetical protein
MTLIKPHTIINLKNSEMSIKHWRKPIKIETNLFGKTLSMYSIPL